MKVSRYAKSILYSLFIAVLIVFSTVYQVSMHTAGGMESAYFKSNTYLFIMAAGCLGIGVYSYFSFSRRHREHKADSLLFLFTGLVLMAAVFTAFINFGGLDENLVSAGNKLAYTAVNVNIILMSALPVPFYIRSLGLACSKREKSPALRRVALAFSALIAVAYISILALGGMMRLVYASDSIDASESSVLTAEKSA